MKKAAAILTLLVLPFAAAVQAEEENAAAEAPTSGATASGEAISSSDLTALESKVGTDVVVEGVVTKVGSGPNDNITFLNFGDMRTGFVAVVFRAAYDKFPEGFDRYAQQKVRVTGRLEKYRDRQVQVKIFTPDQLEILSE